MGTPNRRISLRSYGLLLEVLQLYKPQLHHLPGAYEFIDRLNGVANMLENMRFVYDSRSKMVFPDDFGHNERCFIIAAVEEQYWEVPWEAFGESGSSYLRFRRYLVLDRAGKFFAWDWYARCRSTARRVFHHPPHREPDWEEVAIESAVRIPSSKELRRYLRTKSVADQIVTTLHNLAVVGVMEREDRLDSMRSFVSRLEKLQDNMF